MTPPTVAVFSFHEKIRESFQSKISSAYHREKTSESSAEAFDTWFRAYTFNYAPARDNNPWKMLGWQAWQAAVNYAEQVSDTKLDEAIEKFMRRYHAEFADETQGAAETLGKIDWAMDEFRTVLAELRKP